MGVGFRAAPLACKTGGAMSQPTTQAPATRPPGWLSLVGGGEWSPGCEEADSLMLEASGAKEVLVLPTAAAYEHPMKAIEVASAWFSGLGASVAPCMVLRRADAEDPTYAGAVRRARFIYLGGGSPLHLRSVLKASPVWDALVEAWRAGAVLAGSSAGAMVLGDTMVDPRGGALTLGLGLLHQLAVLPHAGSWADEKTHRTVNLASGGLRIVAIDERTALVRSPEGQWQKLGPGRSAVWVDGRPEGLETLEQCLPG